MKTRTILALTLVLSFVLGGVVMAASVDPIFHEKCPDPEFPGNFQHPPDPSCIITTGDAKYECDQIGDYAFAKRTGPVDGTWPLVDKGTWQQEVNIVGCDDEDDPKPNACYTFDWWVTPDEGYPPVGAVLVKSVGKGTTAGGYNEYSYPEPLFSDEDLSGVVYLRERKNGEVTDPFAFAINHITFCWNVEGVCFEEETAWAEGFPYNPDDLGQWAMYVDYYAHQDDPENPVSFTVDLIAGQNMDAGDVTFSAPDVNGKVTIDIQLMDGWFFYYDQDDIEADDNLKVQDYEEAPEGNPAIGHFIWKASIPIGETTATITVDANNFYGVHVDLTRGEPCDD